MQSEVIGGHRVVSGQRSTRGGQKKIMTRGQSEVMVSSYGALKFLKVNISETPGGTDSKFCGFTKSRGVYIQSWSRGQSEVTGSTFEKFL